MNSKQFDHANTKWAKMLLAQPCYTMPNGKPSHQVAYEVLGKVADRLIEHGTVTAYGDWFAKDAR